MINYRIITSFGSPEGPKARANQTRIDIMTFILVFVESCLYYNAIHDFSVWLRTGYEPYWIVLSSSGDKFFISKV